MKLHRRQCLLTRSVFSSTVFWSAAFCSAALVVQVAGNAQVATAVVFVPTPTPPPSPTPTGTPRPTPTVTPRPSATPTTSPTPPQTCAGKPTFEHDRFENHFFDKVQRIWNGTTPSWNRSGDSGTYSLVIRLDGSESDETDRISGKYFLDQAFKCVNGTWQIQSETETVALTQSESDTCPELTGCATPLVTVYDIYFKRLYKNESLHRLNGRLDITTQYWALNPDATQRAKAKFLDASTSRRLEYSGNSSYPSKEVDEVRNDLYHAGQLVNGAPEFSHKQYLYSREITRFTTVTTLVLDPMRDTIVPTRINSSRFKLSDYYRYPVKTPQGTYRIVRSGRDVETESQLRNAVGGAELYSSHGHLDQSYFFPSGRQQSEAYRFYEKFGGVDATINGQIATYVHHLDRYDVPGSIPRVIDGYSDEITYTTTGVIVTPTRTLKNILVRWNTAGVLTTPQDAAARNRYNYIQQNELGQPLNGYLWGWPVLP